MKDVASIRHMENKNKIAEWTIIVTLLERTVSVVLK